MNEVNEVFNYLNTLTPEQVTSIRNTLAQRALVLDGRNQHRSLQTPMPNANDLMAAYSMDKIFNQLNPS